MFESFVQDYIRDLQKAQSNLDLIKLEKITKVIKEAINNKRNIFMLGNGGSSATPSHSAGDFSKELKAKTICLSDNTPAVTAWANDTEYDNIFSGQLEVFMEPNDIVIGYSGSGNSMNVLNALEYANENECFTIGITGNYGGKGGGKIVDTANLSLIIDTESMERIEDIQLIINHIIKEAIKSDIL